MQHWKEKITRYGKKIKCPVCGQYEFEEEDDYDICPVCFWENDSLQNNDPDCAGGANILFGECMWVDGLLRYAIALIKALDCLFIAV